MDEIIGTFDLQRNMWVVEFWHQHWMWADLTLDKQSARFQLTIFGAPEQSSLALDLHETLHHLLDAKQRILTGTIGDIRTEEESGNYDWRTPDPFREKTTPGLPSSKLRSSDGQADEIVAELYGGDSKWSTLSLDGESGSCTLSILARSEADGWLSLDLDEVFATIFEAQQGLMERLVFRIQ